VTRAIRVPVSQDGRGRRLVGDVVDRRAMSVLASEELA
jgi:hypothetical protein